MTAEIAGERHELEIKQEGSRVTAEIDGRVYELEARTPQPGVYLLMAGGRVYECRVEHTDTRREAGAEVTIGRHAYTVTLADPKRLRGAQTAGGHAPGTSEIVAPMPGKVVRVLVEAGTEVEAGAGVVVVEAMKMQNEMKSPKAGKVTSVNVREGATVNAGDVLVVIE
ncbi:MAG TPA: biotin/lipoyl-containing protein [Pyrinomonadaceae bacterium]|nr:biotin/lipoyl-containing protein [Pyrinomonadaceae bacterium]